MSTKQEQYEEDPILEASISELIDQYQEPGDFDGHKDGPLTPDDLKTGKVAGRWNVANDEAPVHALVRTSDPHTLAWVKISGTEYAFITRVEDLGSFVADTDEYMQDFIENLNDETYERPDEFKAFEAENGGRPQVRPMPSGESIEDAKRMIAEQAVAS